MSATAIEIEPPKVRWDLSSLFSSMDDPRIASGWASATRAADAFAAKYRGKIASENLTADLLLAALQELESLVQESDKPVIYANLLFAADCADPKVGAFMQSQTEQMSALRVKLMFFELELQAAPDTVVEAALRDERLQNYRHFVQVARSLKPYRLSEPEEVILEETANTGSRAWQRLFDELTGNHVFKLLRPGAGEPESMTQEEVLTLLRDPDRGVRQAAADSLSQGLEEQSRVLTYIYNNLLLDKKTEDRLRRHPYAEHSRHLANELDKDTVDLVIKLCRDHYHLVERYYGLKRKLLGLSELTHIDRYAPLFDTKSKIGYDDAKDLILDAFGKFSLEVSARAAEFFDRGWIDAEPRQGKTGGAFCSYNTPDTHPVIFMSYLNDIKDVGTLAHELGHGVHASFSREQTYFNYHGTLPLAELASIFGEMLVFESLVANADRDDQLALYADKIEGTFATVFRQAAMFQFEQKCHNARRAEGELPAERIGEIWQAEIQAMFGSSVTLGEQHKNWWSYVSHFFMVPFYVYAYSFGELLTLALFQKAKAEGATFAEKYIRLLKLGGSMTPQELMATVGVDLQSREFWLGGFAATEMLIERFEQLAEGRNG